MGYVSIRGQKISTLRIIWSPAVWVCSAEVLHACLHASAFNASARAPYS